MWVRSRIPTVKGRTQAREVLDEINHLLETEQGSIVPMLTKATRLADLCGEHEYKLLFQFHLAGIDLQDHSPRDKRVETWPDPGKQPKFDIIKMMEADRRISEGKMSGDPVHVIEHKVDVLGKEWDRIIQLTPSVAGPIIASTVQLRTILTRIRGRVSVFARVVEARLQQEAKDLGPPTLRTIAEGGRIFIGHGHSPAWRDVRDFLKDRLHLPCDEFNHETPAGKSNKEVLSRLLEHACFAFLVMTGEDEHTDGQHARENVIHPPPGRRGCRDSRRLPRENC